MSFHAIARMSSDGPQAPDDFRCGASCGCVDRDCFQRDQQPGKGPAGNTGPDRSGDSGTQLPAKRRGALLPAAATLRRSADRLRLPRLISVGYISVDYVCRVGVLPHRDDRVTAEHIEKALGGPAANVAVAAAGVGSDFALDVELATAVGEDPDSDWALAELARRGVHALTIRRPFNNRLSRCVVVVEANGSRTIINEPFELSEVDLTAHLAVTSEDRPCCLHIEGYHYERMLGSFGRFHNAGWKVSLHTTGLPDSSRTPEAFTELVRTIDLVFVNDVALRGIFAMRTSIATMIDNLEALLHRIGPRADVVLTLGDLGAVVFPRDDSARFSCPP